MKSMSGDPACRLGRTLQRTPPSRRQSQGGIECAERFRWPVLSKQMDRLGEGR
jgi:hypothetical protein